MLPTVSNAVRWGWLLAVPLLLSTGIMLMAGVGTGAFRAPEEQALAVGFGLGGLLLAAVCFARFFTLHYTGWWPYFVRPIAIYACAQSALIAAMFMGFDNLHNEETLVALFFLLFPIAMLPVLFFIRTRPPVAGAAVSPQSSVPATQAGDAPAVSSAARWGWLLATPPFLATGIILVAGVGTNVFRSDDEQALALGFGIGSLLLAIFTFVRFLTTRYTGWWPYFVRPVAVYLCVQSALLAGLFMGFSNLADSEMLAALFFLLLPIVMLPILLIIRTKPPVASAVAQTPSASGPQPASQAGVAVRDAAQQEVHPASVPQPVLQAGVASSMHTMYCVVEPWDIFGWLLAVPAWLLLIAGVAMALVAAVDLPGFIGAGLADPRMAQDLSREFGFERWPVLLRTWMSILAHASLLLAAMLLIVARRGGGAAHMLRVVVSIAVFSMASALLDGSLRGEWIAIGDITGRANVPASIEQYLSNSSRMGAVISLLTLAVGLVVLAWPARKPAASLPARVEEVAR